MERKNVLITGSAGGIGQAIAERFAKEQYNLILHARKETTEFSNFMQKLKGKYDIQITPIYFDITDYDVMKKAIQSLHKEKRSIDVLVNNAGVAHGGMIQMTSLDDIKNVFEINYFSVVQMTQLVLRLMSRKKSGVIINLASVAGLDLEAGNCAYGASKAAVIAFTKTVAKEIASQGIRINAVAPGLTNTRMAAMMEETAGEEMVQASAMKRLGKTEEIADVIYFLASDDASFVTGQTLRIDGGM